MPKTKGAGENVFASSIDREAAIRVRVDKGAQAKTIARIIRLVEEARAPTERFIDRSHTGIYRQLLAWRSWLTPEPP